DDFGSTIRPSRAQSSSPALADYFSQIISSRREPRGSGLDLPHAHAPLPMPAVLLSFSRAKVFDAVGGKFGVAGSGGSIHPPLLADQCRSLLSGQSQKKGRDGARHETPLQFIQEISSLHRTSVSAGVRRQGETGETPAPPRRPSSSLALWLKIPLPERGLFQ